MTFTELTEYILDRYGVEPDYPFTGDAENCAFRHADNRKWFALRLRVPYSTLGLPGEGSVDIVNVKCDPIVIGSLRGRPGIRPAYHMNKDRWLTLLLDGSADREDITALVDMSYALTRTVRRRKSGNDLPR